MVARNTPSLELLQIATPCSASWDEMSGDERVRHCSHCNLNVFNLSDMTREEATAFIATREGRTCVRMFKRADGTVITRNCPVGLAALRDRLVRIALATAGLFFALVTTALAVFTKNPTVRTYLSHGKLDRLYESDHTYMAMGAICIPTPINPVPAPWVESPPMTESPSE